MQIAQSISSLPEWASIIARLTWHLLQSIVTFYKVCLLRKFGLHYNVSMKDTGFPVFCPHVLGADCSYPQTTIINLEFFVFLLLLRCQEIGYPLTLGNNVLLNVRDHVYSQRSLTMFRQRWGLSCTCFIKI